VSGVVVGEGEFALLDCCSWKVAAVVRGAELEEVCVAGEGDVVRDSSAGDVRRFVGIDEVGQTLWVAADVDLLFFLVDGDVLLVEDGRGESVFLDEVI
jgi:hypothetical protein